MKKCNKCKLEKPLVDFCKNKLNKDGLHCWCKKCSYESCVKYKKNNKHKINEYQRKRRLETKACEPDRHNIENHNNNARLRVYRKTAAGRAATMWSGLVYRSKHKYCGVEVRFIRDDFIEWAIPKIEKFLELFPDETPSIDRIDPNGHYEFTNVRVISLKRNVIRSSMLMKKIGLTKQSTEQEVFRSLAMSVISVCSNTGCSVKRFSDYMTTVSDDKYLWEGQVV